LAPAAARSVPPRSRRRRLDRRPARRRRGRDLPQDLAALEQRLRARCSSSGRDRRTRGGDGTHPHPGECGIIADSEQRQQRELTLRTAEVIGISIRNGAAIASSERSDGWKDHRAQVEQRRGC
jgi:hypothetical protein